MEQVTERTAARFAIGWQRSVLRAFCEVPLVGGPYRAIEIQRMERDGVHGHAVVLYRADGTLDIRFEAPLALDAAWARREPATSHLPVRSVAPVRFEQVRCVVAARAVDVLAEFDDPAARRVRLRVRADALPAARPLSTPAPAGVAHGALRFINMDIFHLLPRGCEVEVSIDGAPGQVRAFLLPRAVAPYTAIRAADELLLASLGPGERADGVGGIGELDPDGLGVRDGRRWMALVGLPDAAALDAADGELTGAVRIESDLGVLARGRFRLVRDAEGVRRLRLEDVRQDWSPGKGSLTRAAMRRLRRYRRRGESWAFVEAGP